MEVPLAGFPGIQHRGSRPTDRTYVRFKVPGTIEDGLKMFERLSPNSNLVRPGKYELLFISAKSTLLCAAFERSIPFPPVDCTPETRGDVRAIGILTR